MKYKQWSCTKLIGGGGRRGQTSFSRTDPNFSVIG